MVGKINVSSLSNKISLILYNSFFSIHTFHIYYLHFALENSRRVSIILQKFTPQSYYLDARGEIAGRTLCGEVMSLPVGGGVSERGMLICRPEWTVVVSILSRVLCSTIPAELGGSFRDFSARELCFCFAICSVS